MAFPELYNHGYGHPSSKPSVNAAFKGEEEKKKGCSHDKLLGKVIRKKRSRSASKSKTSPIIFLAVDPSNFRAMVHHLTSISSSSSSSSSYLYGDHNISSTISFFNPHPKRPLDEQPERENIYSSSSFHVANPSVLGSTPLFMNPPDLQYGDQSSLLMKEEHDSLINEEFIVDDLDHLQLMLLLDNTNDPSSTNSITTSIAATSSPSLHFINNNNNLEPWWFSNHSSIFPYSYFMG